MCFLRYQEKLPYLDKIPAYLLPNRRGGRARRLSCFLQTATVLIKDANGGWLTIRAVLDEGCSRTLIWRNALLGRQWHQFQESPVQLAGVVGEQYCPGDCIETKIQSRDGRFTSKLDCMVVDDLVHELQKPKIPLNIALELERYCDKNERPLADPDITSNQRKTMQFEMIIGADWLGQFDITPVYKFTQRLVIKDSKLGVVLMGPVPGECVHRAEAERKNLTSFFVMMAPPSLQTPEEFYASLDRRMASYSSTTSSIKANKVDVPPAAGLTTTGRETKYTFQKRM